MQTTSTERLKAVSAVLKKGIQRDSLMTIGNAYDSASFGIAYNGVHVIHSAEANFVYADPSDILHWSTVSVV
jgi:hypothetical protein